MSVEVGSLSYVSTLNNDDFQAKSLQDIKLITTRLQLTGDTSGIEKYDAAFKAAAQAEIQIQKDLNAILEDARIKTQSLTDTIQKPTDKTVFSKMSIDINEAAASIQTFQETGNVALSKVDLLLKTINADFEAGKITATEYKAAIESIGTFNPPKTSAVQFETAGLALRSPDNQDSLGSAAILSANEKVSASLAELNDELQITRTSAATLREEFLAGSVSGEAFDIAINELAANEKILVNTINARIGYQKEDQIQTEKNIVVVKEEINAYAELLITLDKLKGARANPLTPTNDLPLINKQIQETEANVKKFANIGKIGFDDFGNEIEQTTTKSGKFAQAISRVTNLQNLGARVVTQFTRQIIGLGVGFLSLEIGAKAIQSLIEYIENLDVFTGRLDQAKQNLAAFNEVMKNADQASGSQVASLKLLYEQTQNVALSMDKRLEAAQQLRELYPTEFENTNNLSIVNGKLKNSYDELTASIIANAKSTAARSKIAALESSVLDAQFQIDKNNSAKLQELSRVSGVISAGSVGTGGGGSSTGTVSEAVQRQNIISRTNQSNLIPTQTIAIAKGQEKFLTQFVNDISANATKLADANKLLGNELEKFDSALKNATSEALLKDLQSALQAKLNSLSPTDAQFEKVKADLQRVDDLLKKYQVKAATNTTDPAIALLAQQTKVLEDIDALSQKAATKSKTRNEQAVDDVISTYNKQYNAAVAFNVKLAQFRKDHPTDNSPSANKLAPIDTSQIDIAKVAALEALAGVQSVEQTRNQVEQQKAIFKEYEDFKLQAGTEAANKLFGSDLKGYKNYIDYLKSLQPTEQQLTSADPYTKARASALQDYLKTALPQAQAAEFELQQKHLQSLIIQDQDWQQKRETLIARGNEDIAALNAAGFKDQAAQAQQNLNDELTALDVQSFEKIKTYRDLFQNINKLSTDNANTLIKNAELTAAAELATGKITAEAYIKITDALKKIQQGINDRTADQLLALGSGLSEIGREFEGINSNVSVYISSLGYLVTSLGNVKKQYDQFKADAGDANAQIIDGINLAATGISAIAGIIGSITSASAKRKQAETDYYNSVIAFQNQYNLALNEQIRLQYQQNSNIFFTDFAAQLKDGADALTDANKKFTQSLDALSKGQAKVGQKNVVDGSAIANDALKGATAGAVIGSVLPGVGTVVGGAVGSVVGAIAGIFGGKKKADVLAPLLVEYPDLIKKSTEGTVSFNEALAKSLIANNQVSDSTKVLLQNTIDLNDARKEAIDQINSALSTLSASLGANLEDALVTAFENGTDAAKAFGDSVSAVIGNIVQQFLFEDVFGDQFKKLQASLQNTVQAGGSSADITADFVKFFKDAGPLVKEFNDGLKAAQDAGATQGLTLFPSSTSTAGQTSLSGGIQKSITEDTATILEGTLNGIQLGVFNTNQSLSQLLTIAQDQLTAALQIQINTKRTADNSDSLPGMFEQLKSINTNTQGSLNIELRASGLN